MDLSDGLPAFSREVKAHLQRPRGKSQPNCQIPGMEPSEGSRGKATGTFCCPEVPLPRPPCPGQRRRRPTEPPPRRCSRGGAYQNPTRARCFWSVFLQKWPRNAGMKKPGGSAVLPGRVPQPPGAHSSSPGMPQRAPAPRPGPLAAALGVKVKILPLFFFFFFLLAPSPG